jgi:hypothetical protein
MIKRLLFKNPLGTAVVIMLWFILFLQTYSEDLWINAILATLRVGCLVLSYHVYRYYHDKLKKSKAAAWKLFIWYLLLGFSMIAVEIFDYSINGDEFDDLAIENKLYIKDGDDFVLVEDFDAIFEEDEIIAEVIFGIVFSFIIITMAMVFGRADILWHKNKEYEVDIERLKTLSKEAELSELKNQLNPHFLFNALSNIYSIAYLRDKETPDKIMQLSKMLRYVIYETDIQTVPLSKEVEYLLNYIDFQKFKIKREQQIEFQFEGYREDFMIAPLLLLPFIENAFKHSQVSTEEGAWVKIYLETTGNDLYFVVANTISENKIQEILNNTGIGLENTRKRLDLIYKDRHELKITHGDLYKIQLKISNNE